MRRPPPRRRKLRLSIEGSRRAREGVVRRRPARPALGGSPSEGSQSVPAFSAGKHPGSSRTAGVLPPAIARAHQPPKAARVGDVITARRELEGNGGLPRTNRAAPQGMSNEAPSGSRAPAPWPTSDRRTRGLSVVDAEDSVAHSRGEGQACALAQLDPGQLTRAISPREIGPTTSAHGVGEDGGRRRAAPSRAAEVRSGAGRSAVALEPGRVRARRPRARAPSGIIATLLGRSTGRKTTPR